MYPLYRFLYNLFGFSRSQSNGFLVLLPLVTLFLFSEPVYRRLVTAPPVHQAEIARLDSLASLWDKGVASSDEPRPAQLFSFDPNHATEHELQLLGFSQPVAARIIRYRLKGGRFRVKHDLLKITGVDSSHIRGLMPYVALPESILPNTARSKPSTSGTVLPGVKPRSDINEADSTMLISVKGIGSRLSSRILRYRQALGGFYSMDQLYEVYLLDSVVVSRMKASFFVSDDPPLRRLNINSAGQQELAVHPYLKTRGAAAIVTYRLNHGKFESVEDLVKIQALDSAGVRKLKPYLKTAD
jgi:competence protein ComEA